MRQGPARVAGPSVQTWTDFQLARDLLTQTDTASAAIPGLAGAHRSRVIPSHSDSASHNAAVKPAPADLIRPRRDARWSAPGRFDALTAAGSGPTPAPVPQAVPARPHQLRSMLATCLPPAHDCSPAVTTALRPCGAGTRRSRPAGRRGEGAGGPRAFPPRTAPGPPHRRTLCAPPVTPPPVTSRLADPTAWAESRGPGAARIDSERPFRAVLHFRRGGGGGFARSAEARREGEMPRRGARLGRGGMAKGGARKHRPGPLPDPLFPPASRSLWRGRATARRPGLRGGP
jgi:hypothetical protein